MSKQYLTTHSVDNAHPAGIFALATTPTALLSGSGTSAIHVHRTNDASGTFPLVQVLPAHKLGTHHITTAPRGTSNGTVAASVGFGGDIKVWRCDPATGEFALDFDISPAQAKSRGGSDVWAVALDSLEQFLACTTHDGRIHVWDLTTRQLLRTYETGGAGAGSFGTCIDLSANGNLTATGHENGAVYVFDNNVGSLKYSLTSLAKPVRAVSFSPGNTRLAAAGDAGIISLFDVQTGEHVGILSTGAGSSAWIVSLDWSDTGEYLLSGSSDGKVRVWSIERGVCVATHSETEKMIWAVRWLKRANANQGEMFCAAGANGSITFYREGGKS